MPPSLKSSILKFLNENAFIFQVSTIKLMKRNLGKGINTVISSLLLISITIGVAILSYYYIMNYNAPPSTGPVEVIQIDNVAWSSPNKVIAFISNHGSVKRVIDVAFIDGNRGFPNAPVEVSPGETKIIEFTFENNIQPGEHLMKVVCQDGTMGVLTYRFSELVATTTFTSTPTTTTTTTTTTTATSPCFIVQAYYDSGKSTVFPAIRVIQSFRDNVIAESQIGVKILKVFNALYYPISSFLTPLIMQYPSIGFFVRIFSSPIIALTLILIDLTQFLNGEIKVLSSILIGCMLLSVIYLTPSLTNLMDKRKLKNFNALRNLIFLFLVLTFIFEFSSLTMLASIFLLFSIVFSTLLIASILKSFFEKIKESLI